MKFIGHQERMAWNEKAPRATKYHKKRDHPPTENLGHSTKKKKIPHFFCKNYRHMDYVQYKVTVYFKTLLHNLREIFCLQSERKAGI